MTVGLSPAAGRFSTLRDVILRTAVAEFSTHLGGKLTPASTTRPWHIPDAPCVGLFSADPAIDADEEASQCDVVVRFDLVFIVGAPAGDHVGIMADHWTDWVAGKRPLGPAAKDALWDRRALPPVVETVGAFLNYDFGRGQPLLASINSIRTEMHRE